MSYAATTARQIRDHLRHTLGRACLWCGSTTDLQFDYELPTPDGHHELAYRSRMVAYVRQSRVGNLQLLCATCHARKADQDWVMTHLPQISDRAPRQL